MLWRTNLDSIEERHLAEQIELAVPEIRHVDYKKTLPRKSDAAEFLADVCSFANAGGGDLVYGMDEEGGVPTAAEGVPTSDPDGDLLSLEQRILTGIDPRIPGLRGRYVPLGNGNHVFVIRVPRSFARPHAVYRNETPRFVTRNSAGKYAMDVGEIRASVLGAEAVADRMRAFRTARLGDLASGRAPADPAGFAAVVLHVMPMAAFDVPTPAVDADLVLGSDVPFLPIGLGGDYGYTFDGLLVAGTARVRPAIDGRHPWSYALLLRSGAIEAADTTLLWPDHDDRGIPSDVFERDLLDSAQAYLGLLTHLGVEGPVYVGLSLLGVAGYRMATNSPLASGGREIDRDALVAPEAQAETARLDRQGVEAPMRPALDRVWNACGHARSPNFDDGGRWNGGRRW